MNYSDLLEHERLTMALPDREVVLLKSVLRGQTVYSYVDDSLGVCVKFDWDCAYVTAYRPGTTKMATRCLGYAHRMDDALATLTGHVLAVVRNLDRATDWHPSAEGGGR